MLSNNLNSSHPEQNQTLLLQPNKLEKILKEKNVSRKELAEATHISVRTISNICQGSSTSIDYARRISKYLQVSLTEIFPIN